MKVLCCELIGARVCLRPFDIKKDAYSVFRICSEKKTVRFYGMEPMTSIKEAESLLADYAIGTRAGTSVHWAIVDIKTNLLIGDAGLMSMDEKNCRASSYCILDSAYWGKGLSSDAMKLIFDYVFMTSNLNRIQAYIDVRNERAIRSVEGIGFVNEGVLRGYEFDRGEYIDDALFALTRLDWSKRRHTIFGSEPRMNRKKLSWQYYELSGECFVWVYDGESNLYHILKGPDVDKWFQGMEPVWQDAGFELYDNQAVDFLSIVNNSNIPYEIHFDITNACNSNCLHCYNCGAQCGRIGLNDEMSDAECIELFRKLREIGVFRLVISGGEPLLRSRIFELIQEARGLGFQVVFYTNGILLDKDKAKKLADLWPVSVDVSIYGACAQTHDYITGINGSFTKSCNALQMLTEFGINTVMKCVALHANWSEIDDMLELGSHIAKNTLVNYVFYPSLDGEGKCCEQMLRLSEIITLALNPKLKIYYKNGSHQLCRYEPDREYVCTHILNSLYIDYSGDVYPCIAIPRGDGNWQKYFNDIAKSDNQNGEAFYWKSLSFKDIPLCGSKIYCEFCYSTCPGDAFVLCGDETKPAKNHCRLAIARYAASKWISCGHTLAEWLSFSANVKSMYDFLSQLGIISDEYIVWGIE